ncbi:MAG TPA: pentapeptide repeat-containing protein [Candidatus Obscuribacterales bacterium]
MRQPILKPLVGAIALGSALLAIATPAIAQNADHIDQLRRTGRCSSCDLSGADLSGLDLSHAYLVGAFLIGADLSNANLRSANLERAILNGANLSGADFTFADLTDASLNGARIEIPAIFTGATLDRMVMPSGQVRGSSSP